MTDKSIVEEVIEECGGMTAFANAMGHGITVTNLRDIVRGRRIPKAPTRLRMVRASRGRLSERDIIAITGKDRPNYNQGSDVNPIWELEGDELREAIARKAANAARKQRLANRLLPKAKGKA